MKIVVVIPARYGSTRFPAKPLHVVAGRSILERTWRIAKAAAVDDVLIATDDERIGEHAATFGARAVMTPSEVPTGSDRAAATLPQIDADAVINLQGDALLTPPWVLDALADALRGGATFATPAVALSSEQLDALEASKKVTPSSGTTVVIDASGHALYFSKHVLPFARGPRVVHRHIGVYAYTRAALQAYAALPQSALEKAEGLEQLRALEAGVRIRVVTVDYRGRTHGSIDHREDVAIAEAIIAREGELVP